MQRFTRWAFNSFAALSLILCVSSLCLALFDLRFAGPAFRAGGWQFSSGSIGDSCVLEFVYDPDHAVEFLLAISRNPRSNSEQPITFLSILRDLKAPINNRFEFAGMAFLNGDFRRVLQDSQSLCRYYILMVNYWTLSVILAVIPGIWGFRAVRRRRHPPGSCPSCGYDLRATPNRCPECGYEVAAKRTTIEPGNG
jgi:hypothetical protein